MYFGVAAPREERSATDGDDILMKRFVKTDIVWSGRRCDFKHWFLCKVALHIIHIMLKNTPRFNLLIYVRR